MTTYDEQFLTRVFDSVTDPFAIYDCDFRIIKTNQAVQKLFQLTEEQLIGRFCYETFYQRSAICDDCHVQEVFRTGEPRILEKCVPTPDGNERIFEVHSYPIKDHQGSVTLAVEHAREISQRKRAEKKLRESEEKYRSLVDHIGQGVSLISPNMEILTLNKQMKDWFPEIDPATRPLCHRSFHDPPREEVCPDCPTIKTLQDGEVHEAIMATPAGKETRNYRIISSPIKDKDGNVVAAIESVEDITERKSLEEQLQSSREFSDKIINSITDNLIVIDPRTHTIIQANDAFHSRIGLEPPTAVGMRCHEIMLDRPTPCADYGIRCPMEETLRTKGPAMSDRLYPNAAGEEQLLEVATYPLLDSHGEISSIIRLERDVTKKRETEEALSFRSKELQKTQHQLETLFEISRQVSGMAALPEVVHFVQGITHEIFPQSELLFFLVDDKKKRFLELEECNFTVVTPLLSSLGELEQSGLVSDFVQYLQDTKKPQIMSSKHTNDVPDFLRIISKNYPSWFGFPISTPHQCIGYFLLGSEISQDYSREDLHFFHNLFNQIAGDIDHLLCHATEINNLRREVTERTSHGEIIGQSDEMQKIYELIDLVSASDATVLIAGENGTGKELVAQAIHRESHRASGPFIVANCSAYSPALLESELFGHEKGAFTGAIKRKKGRIERAKGGTLFLDEIGDIAPATQVLLLRFLQDHFFERVGGEQTLEADVRVLAASNLDLYKEVEAGRFRDDLYYRLNVITISMPPLRDRMEDIPLLCKHFLEKYSRKEGKQIKSFSSSAMQALLDHDWPGNVRQLENAISHAVILAQGEVVEGRHLPQFLKQVTEEPPSTSLAENERRLILSVLQECGWNKHEAARQLQISRSTLYSKIRRYNLVKTAPSV
jgi:PAS domain S-box-containing protein